MAVCCRSFSCSGSVCLAQTQLALRWQRHVAYGLFGSRDFVYDDRHPCIHDSLSLIGGKRIDPLKIKPDPEAQCFPQRSARFADFRASPGTGPPAFGLPLRAAPARLVKMARDEVLRFDLRPAGFHGFTHVHRLPAAGSQFRLQEFPPLFQARLLPRLPRARHPHSGTTGLGWTEWSLKIPLVLVG